MAELPSEILVFVHRIASMMLAPAKTLYIDIANMGLISLCDFLLRVRTNSSSADSVDQLIYCFTAECVQAAVDIFSGFRLDILKAVLCALGDQRTINHVPRLSRV